MVYPVGPLPANCAPHQPTLLLLSSPLPSTDGTRTVLLSPQPPAVKNYCLSSATLSWGRADKVGFEGGRGSRQNLCRYRAAHIPKEVQKSLFSLAPMQWKKQRGISTSSLSLSHSSKIKACERLPHPHWPPFWESY